MKKINKVLKNTINTLNSTIQNLISKIPTNTQIIELINKILSNFNFQQEINNLNIQINNLTIQINNLQNLINTLQKNIVPIGSIISYGALIPPVGWLNCDGSAINRNDYFLLFLVINTTYGVGDGVNTFNLPDLRGRTIIGTGTGSNLTTRNLGDIGGEETHLLTINEMPSHNHGGFTGYSSWASGRHAMNQGGGAGNDKGQHRHTIDFEGGNNSHNNMSPYIVFNYIIKVN